MDQMLTQNESMVNEELQAGEDVHDLGGHPCEHANPSEHGEITVFCSALASAEEAGADFRLAESGENCAGAIFPLMPRNC